MEAGDTFGGGEDSGADGGDCGSRDEAESSFLFNSSTCFFASYSCILIPYLIPYLVLRDSLQLLVPGFASFNIRQPFGGDFGKHCI